jgi:hypothetical protein
MFLKKTNSEYYLRFYKSEDYYDEIVTIGYEHEPDCCEYNYADFSQIDEEAYHYNFNEKSFRIETVEDAGFRFGDEKRMFFVPCYSEQNGYYSSDIDIIVTRVYNSGCQMKER